MRFVVDETSWSFDGVEPDRCLEALESMLDRMDDAFLRGHGCSYSDELFHRPVRDGLSFYELYSDTSPIPIAPEVRERVAIAFGRLTPWQDLNAPWPQDFNPAIGSSDPDWAPSIAWAHRQTVTSAAQAVACICHPIRRKSGSFDVVVAGTRTPLWFVASARDGEHFFRWLIVETTHNPDQMAELAPSAFESLEFAAKTFDGIKAMSKPYRDLRQTIVLHLASLSDDGDRIFSGAWDRVSAEFASLGIEISDENGSTKRNRQARTERTRIVGGEERVFWWHTKLEPDRDRIPIKVKQVL